MGGLEVGLGMAAKRKFLTLLETGPLVIGPAFSHHFDKRYDRYLIILDNRLNEPQTPLREAAVKFSKLFPTFTQKKRAHFELPLSVVTNNM
jgi:hypothetical protein